MNPELLRKYKKVKCKPNEKIKKGDILVFEYKKGFAPRFLEDCKRTAFIIGGFDEYKNNKLQTLDGKGGLKGKDDGIWTHNIDKDRKFVYKLKLLSKKKKRKISNRDSSYLRLKDLIL